MKNLFLSLAVSLTGLAASAADYPILATYKTQAETLLTQTAQAQDAQAWAQVVAATHTLIDQGVEIMHLYAEKNPNCAAQYEVFIKELPQMASMTVEAAHARYHDGKGLPAAPRHCYFGRSQVIHPVLNLIRLHAAPVTDETRGEVTDDFQEVIEHLAKIQKNLDTPPN